MFSKDLVDKLHEFKIINKNNILWKQFSYLEGRVYNSKEFEAKLESIKYTIRDSFGKETRPIFKIWPDHSTKPFTIKKLKISKKIKAPVLITVQPKPNLHGFNYWHTLSIHKETNKPLSKYLQPHGIGVVLDQTPEFLFWTPFYFETQFSQNQQAWSRIPGDRLNILSSFEDPIVDYRDRLINSHWNKGKRPQTPPKRLGYQSELYNQVPFFEFNPKLKHLTAYPLPIFENKPDLPIIIQSIPDSGKIELLGAGYFKNETGFYWPLNSQQQKRARSTLLTRLDLGQIIN